MGTSNGAIYILLATGLALFDKDRSWTKPAFRGAL
jgi:hypothetical protein